MKVEVIPPKPSTPTYNLLDLTERQITLIRCALAERNATLKRQGDVGPHFQERKEIMDALDNLPSAR